METKSALMPSVSGSRMPMESSSAVMNCDSLWANSSSDTESICNTLRMAVFSSSPKVFSVLTASARLRRVAFFRLVVAMPNTV